ncbi:hypothetical protein [Kitasatospora sp. NE20-6]|uniref:hypothetical protein n=1 Tax=Kitasatospora sp. NE20-6 TaxID=2859066 RepID=UPI0038B3C8EA
MSRDAKLAEVSLTAERTFIYLLNYVDDKGRHLDDAGIVRGLIWKRKKSWDGRVHISERVEDDLRQLTEVGLVCRYVNPEDAGEELLHVVNFNKHQRIDKPSQSRLAACPLHQIEEALAAAQTATRSPRRKTPAGETAQASATASTSYQEVLADNQDMMDSASAQNPDGEHPNTGVQEPLPDSRTPSWNGSRITDPGSVPPGDGSAVPAEATSPADPAPERVAALHPNVTGANALVAEYVRTCPQMPTDRFRGHLGREIHQLLSAGYTVEQVRMGLQLLAANPKGPTALESFVQEALTRRRSRPGATYQAWTNPAAGAAAYAGEL